MSFCYVFRYVRISVDRDAHSTWMFLNRGLCVRAGDSGAPIGTPRVPSLSHCPARDGNLYAFVRELRGHAKLRYLMSEKLFLAESHLVAEKKFRWNYNTME